MNSGGIKERKMFIITINPTIFIIITGELGLLFDLNDFDFSFTEAKLKKADASVWVE